MITRTRFSPRAPRRTRPECAGIRVARFVRSFAPTALAAAFFVAPVLAEPTAPKATDTSYYYDLVEHSALRPVARALDPVRGVRKLTGNPRQALNVDADDQVRLPSTWWQPRVGYHPVSVERMLHGPGPGTGPAPGKIKVTSAKTQGVTPGFFIKDSRGDRFLLKFDPYDYPEMATAADVICTYLYWAAGYNVPDNTIFRFREEDVDFEPGATYSDVLGTKRPITREFLEQVLKRVRRGADGSIRCLASRLLKGKPLGPFEYSGRRRDDPEDLIPHQHRRELRGLWTIAAWTNHADVRGPNSLDMWVTDGGRSFVRHHLIDFGSTLGSGAVAKRSYQTGTEYFIDYGVSARSLVALGLRPFDWEDAVDPDLASIGYIEAANFEPRIWRPDYPNPAFDERTERDIRWGARIVAGMSDELIRAAVERGEYSDPRATEYLTRVLIGRRDKIVAAWPVPHEGKGTH
jgi:hypothetical protein